MKREFTDKRTFSYSKGNTNLNFTLSPNIKSELKDFAECLSQALEDVNECIKSIK